ncbi:MAG: hypothetical protein KGJ38_00365 [Burkholderiaceae bacterium]|jgi:hypothetical protein|nr:hypothetical protein [Ralstonia sp. LMG 7141]MDE2201156.1 hypothetical protein [Burkholderiaceae bacterium]
MALKKGIWRRNGTPPDTLRRRRFNHDTKLAAFANRNRFAAVSNEI